MTDHSYDVIVLGGGSAGTAAARTAAAEGASTVMFNDGELGGLCILRGCMPTKTMLHSAHLIHQARHHGARGIDSADVGFDFQELMANKDAKVARFQTAKVNSIESGGYEAAIEAGAQVVNDVSGGTYDPEINEVAAGARAVVILGHARIAGTDRPCDKRR